MSLRSKKITLSEHLEWYHRSLENPHRKLYVGVINGEKIGIVRFDFESAGDVSEISINLNPRFRGMGHGLTLLSKSIIIHTKSNGGALAATIKKGNCASLKIFYKCGFQKEAENEFLYHLRRD
jgi:L-amino acid N-acyltransferase YncA